MFPAFFKLSRFIVISKTRSYARKIRSNSDVAGLQNKFRSNVGVGNQLRDLDEAGIPLDDIDSDYLEESESDFHKLGHTYDDMEYEESRNSDLKRLRIVRQKYFSETTPNLLTWSEKEQIRFLHNKNPDEWTPKKISECFPVTENIAKKLLNYAWKPATEARMARHDASVLRNWKELKENTLDGIPAKLRKHFLTFTDRKIPPRIIQREQTESPYRKPGEFESIVAINTSAPSDENGKQFEDPLTNNLTVQEKRNTPPKKIKKEMLTTTFDDPYSGEAFLQEVSTKNINPGKYMTLSDLQNKISEVLQSGKELDESEQHIIDTLKNKELSDSVSGTTAAMMPSTTLITYSSDMENSVLSQQDTTTECKFNTYPEHIKIPKKVWKKGGTYKVRDCYYDDDGQFLYRVPGM